MNVVVVAAPSAVQVQVGSDASAQQLYLLGPPINTVGCQKIRIATDVFVAPIQVVRCCAH